MLSNKGEVVCLCCMPLLCYYCRLFLPTCINVHTKRVDKTKANGSTITTVGCCIPNYKHIGIVHFGFDIQQQNNVYYFAMQTTRHGENQLFFP